MNTRIAAIAVIAALVGTITGSLITSYNDAQADITVMPCSAWADTQYPTIPAYTFTGACVNADGSLSVAK